MQIKRDYYLNKLIDSKNDGLIKVITGIRRCGKSYLLDPLFIEYLKSIGVNNDHIIKLELDREKNKKYRNPEILDEYLHSLLKDNDMYYIILDEIQLVEGFEGVLIIMALVFGVMAFSMSATSKDRSLRSGLSMITGTAWHIRTIWV